MVLIGGDGDELRLAEYERAVGLMFAMLLLLWLVLNVMLLIVLLLSVHLSTRLASRLGIVVVVGGVGVAARDVRRLMVIGHEHARCEVVESRLLLDQH